MRAPPKREGNNDNTLGPLQPTSTGMRTAGVMAATEVLHNEPSHLLGEGETSQEYAETSSAGEGRQLYLSSLIAARKSE